jgi:homoserine O-acetyltransferase
MFFKRKENMMSKSILVLPVFKLENGIELSNLKLSYKTFGSYDESKKVVWVCHALTGNEDVFDWWPGLFGEDELFNTNNSFIICVNAIGSHYSSASPLNITQDEYKYSNFPLITSRDIANSFEEVRNDIGIEKIDILIGASLGGQHALEWSVIHPERFGKLILIATNAKHSSYGIAFNETQRNAIENDPTYRLNLANGGSRGMSVARSIAMLSYRSYEGYHEKQSEDGNEIVDGFKAASYQNYQGEKLISRFNAYSYHALTKTMDAHNVARERGEINDVLGTIRAKTLVVGVDSDMLFPIKEQLFLSDHIPDSDFVKIKSKYGHDGFLIETDQLTDVIADFLVHELRNFKPTVFRVIG